MGERMLQLDFGALAPPLIAQIDDAISIDTQALASAQRNADAITRLYVNGLLTASETRSARQRLTKQVAAACKYVRGEQP